jgi:hypothetical protein
MKTKFELPTFVSDLYRDLRDRRLLIPVAGLLVAIVAVPVLLKSGSSAAPPPAPASAASAEDATPVAPAVVVDDAGVREYRKRLAELERTNPFAQKYALPTPESVALQSSGSGSGGSDASTATTSSSAGASTSVDTTITESSSAGSTSSSVTTDTTVASDERSGSTPDQSESGNPEPRFYAGTIDVTVGKLGDTNRIDDVRYLDLLPNEKAPVVAFVGLANGADAALFSISRDVVETHGDGSCAPKKPTPCEFLTLGVGDQEMLKTAHGSTYRLRLLDTHIVRVPDPRTENSSDQSAATDG